MSVQAATTGSPWWRNGPTQLRMRWVCEQRERREDGSVVSAWRMGRDGGGLGFEAHWRVWASFVGLRPAMAMEVRGEDDVLRNLRASLRTYLPVKPDAPRIIRSNFVAFGSIFLEKRKVVFRITQRRWYSGFGWKVWGSDCVCVCVLLEVGWKLKNRLQVKSL